MNAGRWLAAIAIAGTAAALATERGRGRIGDALIGAGIALLPLPPDDPARDERIRRGIADALGLHEHGGLTDAQLDRLADELLSRSARCPL